MGSLIPKDQAKVIDLGKGDLVCEVSDICARFGVVIDIRTDKPHKSNIDLVVQGVVIGGNRFV